MDKEKLEYVSGISRFFEALWIERDTDGTIKQVYDWKYKPVEKEKLSNSFICISCKGGFTYKDELIEMEKKEVVEASVDRSFALQRRTGRNNFAKLEEYYKDH